MPIAKKYLKIFRGMAKQYCTSKYGSGGIKDKWVQGVHSCPKSRQVFYSKMRKEGIDYRKLGFSTEELKIFDELAGITTTDVLPLQPKIFPGKKDVKSGIYLISKHARLIIRLSKKAIIKSIKFKKHIDEELYLITNKVMIGTIVLSKPRKITIEEFKNLFSEHQITEEERKEWCKEYKGWCTGPLYYYPVEVKTIFTKPKAVKVSKGIQTFIEEVEFLPTKKMTYKDLDYYHILSHIEWRKQTEELSQIVGIKDCSWCQFHWDLIKEFKDRNYPHIYKETLDRIPELLIKDWKTYNPSNINDQVLRDDWRIVNAWMKKLKEGVRFTSTQFKDLTLERQKQVVRRLGEKIRKEMIKRGWEPAAKLEWTLPEGMTIEDIDIKYVKELKNKTLIEVYQFLHKTFKERDKVTEDVHDSHIFVGIEMYKRGIYFKNKIDDELTKQTELEITEYPSPRGLAQLGTIDWNIIKKQGYISLQNVIAALPKQLTIKGSISRPISIYIVGRIVNEGKIPLDHDIDILFKTHRPDPKLLKLLFSSIPDWLSERLHPVKDIEGPEIGNAILIYEPGNIFSQPTQSLSDSIIVGRSFVGLKAKSGIGKHEFWDIEDMWKTWAVNYIDRGIIIDKKYDGRRFQIHYDKNKNIFKIITEDRQRDRSNALSKLSTEIKNFLSKKVNNVILDTEAVVYDCKDSPKDKESRCDFIEREDTAFLTIGTVTPEQEDSTIFHVHDILLLNNKPLNDLAYSERRSIFRKLLGSGIEHLQSVKSIEAENRNQFFRGTTKMRNLLGSEGIMGKVADSKYRIKYSGENRTSEWAKLKNLKEIDVMVWNKVPMIRKKGPQAGQATGSLRYEAVYLLPCNKKEQFTNVVEYQNKCYAKIGMTYGTSEKNTRGDIITVKPIRIRKYEKEGKIVYTWMFPFYAGKRKDKKEADSLTVVERIAALGTKPMRKQKLMKWYFKKYNIKLSPEIILEKLTDKELEEYAKTPIIEIELNKCPFATDETICKFKERFWKPVLSKFIMRKKYLAYPVDCSLADIFRCRYIKDYYYKTKDLMIDE